MIIVKKLLNQSRPDAVRLTRKEKTALILLAHAATTLDDLQTELAERLRMVDNGAERLNELSKETDKLLDDLRVTAPENQRKQLENTGSDYEMRLVPKLQPSVTNVIMEKEELRQLVDCARVKCVDCTEDDNACKQCGLYRLLTSILPLEHYNGGLLCPYNMAVWRN